MPEILSSAGSVIHFDTQGAESDPAIVLIEGLGAHMVAWREQFCRALIEAGFLVVRFDNRDVGLSGRWPQGGYSLSDLAEDTHDLITHLGLGATHVVGQSMGGMVAQHLAIQHPDDVASLALIYSTPSASFVAGVKGPELLRAAPHAQTRDEAVKLHVESERVGASRDFSWDESWKATLGGLMWDRGYDPDGVVRQCRALFADHIDVEAFASGDVPVFIMHGTTDAVISSDASLALHRAIPSSELWLVEGLGHDLPVEMLPDLASRIIANARRATTSPHARGGTA